MLLIKDHILKNALNLYFNKVIRVTVFCLQHCGQMTNHEMMSLLYNAIIKPLGTWCKNHTHTKKTCTLLNYRDESDECFSPMNQISFKYRRGWKELMNSWRTVEICKECVYDNTFAFGACCYILIWGWIEKKKPT